MRLANEGKREMLIATVVAAAAVLALGRLHWAATLPVVIVWAWAISFFRDPVRAGLLAVGEICAPADGLVTEVRTLEHDDLIGGPVDRVGIFLSIFNVHANRAPCAGIVREVRYVPGRFLDARSPESSAQNESNALVIEAAEPLACPIVVRQVAGRLARRIVCHARPGEPLAQGQRFGMIKFGSRTELILPATAGTDITVKVGDKVKAGLTVVARHRGTVCRRGAKDETSHESHLRRPATPGA